MTDTLDALRGATLAEAPIIAPSMLKCDYARLADDISELIGTGWLHWDVMDGHFVPNLSYGAMVIDAVKVCSEHRFEAHLMISDPATYAESYVAAGCDLITFHIEADGDAASLCDRLHDADALAGIAINPDTPVSAITSLAGKVDNVLVMSVNPGFGGQSFMPEVLSKCSEIRDTFGPDVLLSIDGGIDGETIAEAAAADVDLFVVGSAIFNEADKPQAIAGLSAAAKASKPAR